jgi:hypothetical protein
MSDDAEVPEGGDRKFRVGLIKRSNGDPIPEDEPIFILRARDYLALPLLAHYIKLSQVDDCTEHHLQGLNETYRSFDQWQHQNFDKLKQPGITRGLPLSDVCPECHVPRVEHDILGCQKK